jgi:hypothetical protein
VRTGLSTGSSPSRRAPTARGGPVAVGWPKAQTPSGVSRARADHGYLWTVDNLGLVALVFMVIPGLIADHVYRACWGLEKGGRYDRTVRALVWSIVGLGVFTFIFGGPPNYLPVLTSGATAADFGRWTLPALLAHTVFAGGARGSSGSRHRAAGSAIGSPDNSIVRCGRNVRGT